MSEVLAGMALVINPEVLTVALVAAVFGVFVGAVPGLTATLAVALLVPLTFHMEPIPAITAVVTTSAMAIFAGDIPGTYLNIPGTPSSAAYVADASALGRQGRARQTLGVILVCSMIGGLAGSVMLMLVAPTLAEFALNFSSFEYFWLAVLGLSCAAFIASGTVLKSLLSLMLGLFLATVGLDVTTGAPRFTFDIPDLFGGINFIPVMIGFFAISEVMYLYRNLEGKSTLAIVKDAGAVFEGLGRTLRAYWRNVTRGCSVGVISGVLPGAGADLAAWIAYALGKKRSRTPERFGKGHIEGIVDAGSANNTAVIGAYVPALVFGIPGDSITAIVIGVLYVKGINPGPTIFSGDGAMVYALFTAFFVANLILLPVGYMAIRLAHMLARIPARVLMPVILCFSIVGAFAINNSVTDLWIMLLAGVAGYLMISAQIPLAPAILGLVLGNMLENNFMASMLKTSGNFLEFVSRPLSAVLASLVLLIVLWPLLRRLARRHAGQARPPG
ncbi:tripartite tricarboxylate transporter permease [Orrella sp. JC864]|uniref:tripartite tricarboxylate transporter permease n=1 Tax=Orrella sp. JC864 TaxID=3120298 RepID=UPI00300B6A82